MNRFAKGIIAGGLLGAAIGAVLILRSSPETQEKILARTREMGDSAKRTAHKVANHAAHFGSSVKSNTLAFTRRFTDNRPELES